MASACLQLRQQRPAQRSTVTSQDCACSSSRQILRAPAISQLAQPLHTTQCSKLAKPIASKASWRVHSIPVSSGHPAFRQVPKLIRRSLQLNLTCNSEQVTGPGAPAQPPQDSASEQTGQISQQVVAEMKQNITSELDATRVEITDTYGDGRHVSIDVVSNAFEVRQLHRSCTATLSNMLPSYAFSLLADLQAKSVWQECRDRHSCLSARCACRDSTVSSGSEWSTRPYGSNCRTQCMRWTP